MNTLLLLRHAKSDWDSGAGPDHDRPLAARGRRAAAVMGRFMSMTNLVPELCLTSTAVRAADTLARAARAGGWEQVPIRSHRSLYGADPSELARMLQALPDDFRNVLFVGHEPGWSGTVRFMTGGASVRMATGTLARIDFQADRWIDCRPGTGILTGLFPPRILQQVVDDVG